MSSARHNLPQLLRVARSGPVRLRDRDAQRTLGWQESRARAGLARLGPELAEMQYKMYAAGLFGVLVVLQAVDSGGKDSTIRHVFAALSPQGCTVRAFKTPSAEEQRHDYLWRVHQHVPARGEIVLFNRSLAQCDIRVVTLRSLPLRFRPRLKAAAGQRARAAP